MTNSNPATSSPTKKIVDAVILFFTDREGFDGWWYSIAPEDREYLKADLAAEIEDVLKAEDGHE